MGHGHIILRGAQERAPQDDDERVRARLLAFGIDLLLFVFVHFLDDGIAAGFAGGLRSSWPASRRLDIEVWSGGVFAGRVAVVLGGESVWAIAACASRRSALDSKSDRERPSCVWFSSAWTPVRPMKTAVAL